MSKSVFSDSFLTFSLKSSSPVSQTFTEMIRHWSVKQTGSVSVGEKNDF